MSPATHDFVMKSPPTNTRFSHRAKKHKANLRKIHIELKANASIDLEKGASLDGGVARSSQGVASTVSLRNQELSSL